MLTYSHTDDSTSNNNESVPLVYEPDSQLPIEDYSQAQPNFIDYPNDSSDDYPITASRSNEIGQFQPEFVRSLEECDNEDELFDGENDVLSFCLTSRISREEVLRRVVECGRQILAQMKKRNQKDIRILIQQRPNQSNSDVNPIIGTYVLYDDKSKAISLRRSPRSFASFVKVLAVVASTLRTGEIVTKRGVFYSDPTLFGSQHVVDRIIEDIARMADVPRTSLGVVACPRGFVSGPIVFADGGGETDCLGRVVPIPASPDAITAVRCSGVAVIVVEKESVFMRLVQATISREVVIITGRGVPDYATRLFVRLLEDALKVPIVGLFDADAYGCFIMHTYRYGSRAASGDGMGMGATRMRWLGVRPSDVERIPAGRCKTLRSEEICVIKRLLAYAHLENTWRDELELLLKLGRTAEIESLLCGTGEDLIDTFLPAKFASRDWI